jgi:hypothetical protein
MKKEFIATHELKYKMDNGHWHSQRAYGKTDLFNCIRAMMKDGYTEFEIKTLKPKTYNETKNISHVSGVGIQKP